MPSVGYWFGSPPVFGGQGSMAGPASNMVPSSSAQAWHPTVVNLLVLLVVEISIYGALRWAFRAAHGG